MNSNANYIELMRCISWPGYLRDKMIGFLFFTTGSVPRLSKLPDKILCLYCSEPENGEWHDKYHFHMFTPKVFRSCIVGIEEYNREDSKMGSGFFPLNKLHDADGKNLAHAEFLIRKVLKELTGPIAEQDQSDNAVRDGKHLARLEIAADLVKRATYEPTPKKGTN